MKRFQENLSAELASLQSKPFTIWKYLVHREMTNMTKTCSAVDQLESDKNGTTFVLQNSNGLSSLNGMHLCFRRKQGKLPQNSD